MFLASSLPFTRTSLPRSLLYNLYPHFKATIEALQAEREAMRKKMQDLMKKNQHLEDSNEKKGRKKAVPKGKKTQFGQQGVGLD